MIVIVLWGPSKIPELARALGKAKGEFDKATKEFSEAADTASKPSSATASATQNTGTADEILIDTAKRLGIPTEGKTKAQISAEVSEKIKVIGGA